MESGDDSISVSSLDIHSRSDSALKTYYFLFDTSVQKTALKHETNRLCCLCFFCFFVVHEKKKEYDYFSKLRLKYSEPL